MLRICTDWQVVGGSDPMAAQRPRATRTTTDEVLERLGRLHLAALELLVELGCRRLARFGGYGGRLSQRAGARPARVRVDWVTKPVIDSYHTVWFELHEDLLATLGRSRGASATPGRGTGPEARGLHHRTNRTRGAPMTARFGRVITAMVTPFDDNGELDLDAAAELAQFLVETGSDGLVLSGTTGESPVLDGLRGPGAVPQGPRGRVACLSLAGAGSNSTRRRRRG